MQNVDLHYFDCAESHASLDSVVELFLDCTAYFPHLSNLDDIIDVSDICLPERVLNYVHHTHKDITLDVTSCLNCPSPSLLAHLAESLGCVDLLPPTVTANFPIIFDTGDSLTIKPG